MTALLVGVQPGIGDQATDRAMYRAKDLGRNRTEAAPTTSTQEAAP